MFNCYEFTFDGESSAMYGLMVYDIGGRGQSDVSFGNKASIVETRTNNRIQPIYFGANYHSKPLEFKLVFGAERELDRYELEDIAYWLTGHKEYKWLSIGQQDMEQLQFRCSLSKLTDTFTIGGNYDGTLSVTSSATGVATVSRSGNTVTVSHVHQTNGEATITVSCTAGTNYSAPASKTVKVTAEFILATLNDNSWAAIHSVSGTGASYWAVGDRKAVTVNGTVGTQAVNGTYYAYIIGFNHNSSKEGNGITFGTFKTALSGGTDICLVDGKYNGYSTNGTKYFNMNHSSNTNAGGWKGCDLRYDVLGSTNTNDGDATATTATNPVANTLMAALPSDLRAVMQPMTIYTDNTGGGSDNASYVTKTTDYLPLLAEYEIFGTRTYANSAEKNYQAQYAYYSAGNSKVKYCHSSTSSTAWWWERSPRYDSSTYFCIVNTNGSANYTTARLSSGVAPAFRV